MATAAALLLLFWISPSARGFSLPLQRPGDCGDERYFDISRLSCGPCGAHQRRSASGERAGAALRGAGTSGGARVAYGTKEESGWG